MIAIIGTQNMYVSEQGYVAVSIAGEPVLEIVSGNVIKSVKLAACVIEELIK
jgi:Asp-tRNA(Asn)/Glu-tRNA(Gln) amidotransferase B subunit